MCNDMHAPFLFAIFLLYCTSLSLASIGCDSNVFCDESLPIVWCTEIDQVDTSIENCIGTVDMPFYAQCGFGIERYYHTIFELYVSLKITSGSLGVRFGIAGRDGIGLDLNQNAITYGWYDGSWKSTFLQSPITSDQWYNFKITVINDVITVYVNDFDAYLYQKSGITYDTLKYSMWANPYSYGQATCLYINGTLWSTESPTNLYQTTDFPSNAPTETTTDEPSQFPTNPPTMIPYLTQYIDGNVSCNNLHENVGIEYDKEITECIKWCQNRDDCEVFNYFEDFKQTNDSRCYIFDKLCDIQIDNERKSMIGYSAFDKQCVNYPSNWVDSTGDDCEYYQSHNWCKNKTILRNENDFYDLIDYKYELTAIDSCCECGRGVHVMDNVAFSMDNWMGWDDILCRWEHSSFTPQSGFRRWNNIILYDLCDELQDINCNMLIDTEFNANDYDYSLYFCDHTSMEQHDTNFSFVFDAVIDDESQTYGVFINTLWFNLDLNYYSSNVNVFHLNYSQCIENIMNLSNMDIVNKTTNYGIHPCYVLDLTSHPTNDPTTNPTNPTEHPTLDPSFNPTNNPSENPTFDPSFNPTNNPSKYPTFHPSNHPTFYPSFDPINNPTTVDLVTTTMPKYSPTHQVSIQNERFMFDNASTYVIICILSLILVVCSVGVILLFCVYKKKDDEDTRGMENNNEYVHHRPSVPVLQEEDANIYCILCCERKANMFNDPCGHVTYCSKCSSMNSDNKCPSCRRVITEFKQLYNAGFAQ